MRSGWIPILDGDAAARAREIIDAIAIALRHPPPPYNGRLVDPAMPVALLAREPGFAVFFAYLARATHDADAAERAQQFLATAVDALPHAVDRPYFGFGVAGLGWTLQHLDGAIVEADVEGLDEIDASLVALAATKGIDYALSKGLVGYAIYALERLPRASSRALLETIVAQLVASAERSHDGISWRVPPEQVSPQLASRWPNGMSFVGVMYGTAGVLAVLAAAAAAGVAVELAEPAIRDGLRWLRAQCRGAGDALDLPSTASGDVPAPSWAHGAIGVAAALVATARPDLCELGVALGRAAARHDATGVVDASLLRGTAGIAHCFHRLFHATGDAAFLDAARRWFATTLAMYKPDGGLGGYRFWAEEWVKDFIPELETGFVDQAGVLEGIAGVGLALLAATTPVAPDWDRMLLVSRRQS